MVVFHPQDNPWRQILLSCLLSFRELQSRHSEDTRSKYYSWEWSQGLLRWTHYLFIFKFFNNFLHNIFWSYSSLSPDSSQVLLTSLAKPTSCSFSLSHSLGRKQNRKNNKNQLDKKNSKTNKKVDKATKHDLSSVSVGQLGSPWSVAVTPSDTPLEKTASPFPSRSP